MQIKDYQQKAIDAFADFWRELSEWRRRAAENGLPAERDRSPERAWTSYEGRHGLPKVVEKTKGIESRRAPPWVDRRDGRGRQIPHVCLKVPTGGGKTLLGAAVVRHMQPRAGIVLWITPSKAIFKQTDLLLRTRQSVYRQFLDLACGGRVKMLKKDDRISEGMLRNNLCVMPLMLQASARRNSKDFLRIFRDSSRHPDVFPDRADRRANDALLDENPDLERHGLDEDDGAPGMVKHSLFNLLKMARPIIVLDEAHNAYSPERRAKLAELNPRFVLELSATPEHGASNILVSISGRDLQKEAMIKLPLWVSSSVGEEWQQTLAKSKEQRDRLEEAAKAFGERGGRYIRPIMLVRVERTGREQRDGQHIHAEDVRQHLMVNLGVGSRQIRVKTSDKDEVGSEDLLSPTCEVRYVITKAALQEGWDCPFAYVLAILDKTKTDRAVTQMTGRILRQPYAERTGVEALDSCYIRCRDREVGGVALKIKKGLENEGMGDLVGLVAEQEEGAEMEKKAVRRRCRDVGQIFPPRVLRRLEGGGHRLLEYERDIHSLLDWSSMADGEWDLKALGGKGIREETLSIDLLGRWISRVVDLPAVEHELGLEFFVRRLEDVCPNAWVAARVAERAIASWKKEMPEEEIAACRTDMSEMLRRRFVLHLEEKAEQVFRRNLEAGEIVFSLVADRSDYEIPLQWEETIPEGTFPLGTNRSLQTPVYGRTLNGLETKFALYVDQQEAIRWWHRLVAREAREGGGSYGLQGWRRHLVYPDFVVSVKGDEKRVLMLETKGLQLLGNADTEYKRALFRLLEEVEPFARECGSIELEGEGGRQQMSLRILGSDDYKEKFHALLEGLSLGPGAAP